MIADHAVDRLAPRWPRLVVVRALLPFGILGALALSAAATVDMATRNHVPDGTLPGTIDVRPAAVLMIEIVSVAGTLLAIFGTKARTRNRGMVAVLGIGFVQLIAGVTAFGWFGLVPAVGAVYLVHLAAEAWQELREEAAARSSTTPAPERDQPVAAVVDAVTSEDDVPAVEPDPVLDEPSLPRPTPAGPLHGPWSAPVGPVEGPLTLVDHLRARPVLPSERDLVAELNDGVIEALKTTRHRVKGALREARTGLREVA